MTWAVVQGKQNTTGTGLTSAVAFTSVVGSGNVVVGYFFYTGTTNTITSIQDDKSNNYTVVDFTGAQGFGFGTFWSIGRLSNGPQTITATSSSSQTNFWVGVDEFSQSSPGIPTIDGHSIGSGNSAAASSGSFATANNGDLIFAAEMTVGGGNAAGSGFTILEGNGTQFSSEWQVQSSAGSIAGTFTQGANSWECGAFALSVPVITAAASRSLFVCRQQ